MQEVIVLWLQRRESFVCDTDVSGVVTSKRIESKSKEQRALLRSKQWTKNEYDLEITRNNN